VTLPTPGIIAFADALTEPVIVIDRRGLVVHRNGAAKSQFAGVAIGVPVTLSLRNPDLVRAIERARQDGVTSSIELHETVPSETWNKVVVAPLRLPGRDWETDEQRLLAITFQSLTELKRVDAMRADFIANASHELRTPLASLLGFIETLQGPAARDDTAREKFLGIMRNQAERMSRLIEDMLSLSRIEMHQHLRPTGQVDLARLVREVVDVFETRATDAGIALKLEISPTTAAVTGDNNQLYEVVENLIDNAFKYAGPQAHVVVALEPTTRPGYAYMLSVTDNGPGVAEEHVPRLTERFYRTGESQDRRRKGTGLGLAIVKHIVTRHRGLITIRSRPGEGMRVEILLPH
jgi:two-component system phosphate regulon sensor histidine kinase PhoR